MTFQAPVFQWVAAVVRDFVTHLEGLFCKMRHKDVLSWKNHPQSPQCPTPRRNAPPGDGDEGSEEIVHWCLLILV